MYMLGGQTLFGDSGGRARRGEGVTGHLLWNYLVTRELLPLIITNSAVHSRPGFQCYRWGWIPDSMGWIQDSGDWILDSKALDSGFHRQKSVGFWISDSLTWGENLFVNARHSQSNGRKSNSIEFNRTQSVNWVRLSPAIEHNRTPNFVWVRFPNQSKWIEQIEPNRTQSIGLCSIKFGYRTQLNTVRWIAFDCVRWISSLEHRSCYVVWLPAWLLYASSV